MAHRVILTTRQRSKLFDLPRDRSTLMARYVLNDEDLMIIRSRKGAANQLGFAIQLCAFRWPGRLISPGELIPREMLIFISNQLGFDEADIAGYGRRSTTRYQHSSALQRRYGYRPLADKAKRELMKWLVQQAGATRMNVDLAAIFLEKMRSKLIIVPRAATVERLCANALVQAENAAITKIAERLDDNCRGRLLALLEDTEEGRLSRFVWLRRLNPGANSADMHRLLDRCDIAHQLNLPDHLLEDLPGAQIDRLRQQGERLFGASLRKLALERRLAILAVSALIWRNSLTDAAIETNDRILGKLWSEAERHRDATIRENRRSTSETLKGFVVFGSTLIRARKSGKDIDGIIETNAGWEVLESLVNDASLLTNQIDADPIDYISCGQARLHRYARRFLSSFDWHGGKSSRYLLAAVNRFTSGDNKKKLPIGFASPKWRSRINVGGSTDKALWEIAVLYELRTQLRSGDVWVKQSAKYQQIEKALLPMPAVKASRDLAVPFDVGAWLDRKRFEMTTKLEAVDEAARYGLLANAELKNGKLKIKQIERAAPFEAEELVVKLYEQMKPVKITDLLMEADNHIGFSEAFTDLRNGVPPADRKELMTVLLADGINLGIKKMADACPDYSYWELLRVGTWNVRPETYHRALSMVVDAHTKLPFAKLWGDGKSSSSDGQHISAGAQGEAMNIVNAKYGNQPGMSSYAHVSDQFAPFHVQRIGATAHEAPHIIDGLLLHGSGLKIKEHFTDTGGFTDHVFAVCAMLGFRFAPRIRGLADNRLYAFEPTAAPDAVRDLIARPINEKIIREGWPDMLAAPADGHTVLIASPTPVIELMTAQNPAINPKNVKIVCFISAFNAILMARPNRPWSTWSDLVSYAKAHPGKLKMGMTYSELVGSALSLRGAGAEAQLIPYASTSTAVTDMLGGKIDVTSATPSTALSLYPNQASTLLNATKRPLPESVSKQLGYPPHAVDLGYPAINYPRWIGVHPDTPDDLIVELSQRIGDMVSQRSLKTIMGRLGEDIIFVPHLEAQRQYNELLDGVEAAILSMRG